MKSKIYQSQLLSELNNNLINIKENKKIINETLEKIKTIGDIIFIYPLFDIYKLYYKTSIGYYILDTIIGLNDTNEVGKILIEIIEKGYYEDFGDLMYVYEFFYRFGFINNSIVNKKCLDYINEISNGTISFPEYEFEFFFLEYIKKAKLINEIDEQLLNIGKNNEISLDIRIECFNLWLSIDPSNRIDLIINNYVDWFNSVSIEVIAKTSIKWKGTKTEKLRELLLVHGDNHSKYVIENFLETKKNKTSTLKIKKDSEDLENILFLVMDIVILRQEINRLFFTKFKIENFFIQDETIIAEGKLANNERELIAIYARLRTFLNNFENLNKFITLDINEKRKIVPNTKDDDLKKPINSIVLFFEEKNIKYNTFIEKLRKIQKLVSIAGVHQEDKSGFIKILTELDLIGLYNSENWQSIHKNVFSEYKDFLMLLKESLL